MKTLKQAIENVNMTQADLARKMGVTSQAVGGWIKKGVPPRKALALEKLLKVDRRKLCPKIMWDY